MNNTSRLERYIRKIIFGAVGRVVSGVGLLSGIDVAGTPKSVVVVKVIAEKVLRD